MKLTDIELDDIKVFLLEYNYYLQEARHLNTKRVIARINELVDRLESEEKK